MGPPSTHPAQAGFEIPVPSARVFSWRKTTVSGRGGCGVAGGLSVSEWMSHKMLLMKVDSAGLD